MYSIGNISEDFKSRSVMSNERETNLVKFVSPDLDQLILLVSPVWSSIFVVTTNAWRRVLRSPHDLNPFVEDIPRFRRLLKTNLFLISYYRLGFGHNRLTFVIAWFHFFCAMSLSRWFSPYPFSSFVSLLGNN